MKTPRSSLIHFSKNVMTDIVFYGLALFTIFVIIVASIFYHHVEGWPWIDALYFSVITISTVGYGDLSPHTNAGKIFTIVYILIGLGLFVSVTANLGNHLYHSIVQRNNRDSQSS